MLICRLFRHRHVSLPVSTARVPSKSLAGETTRSELGSSGETPAKAQQPRLLQQPTRAEVGRHRRERGRGRRDRRRLRGSGGAAARSRPSGEHLA